MTQAFRPERMPRSEAFRRACERNALRKEAKLPLLRIAEAVDEELRRDAIRLHYAAAEHHRLEFENIKTRVTEEWRAEHGGARITPARQWIVTLRSNREFAAFLAAKGFARPEPMMVAYGSDKAKAASSGEIDLALLDQLSF